MKLVHASFLLAALSCGHAQAAPVYKCTTADGRVIFSSAGCGTENGQFEAPDLKINNVGRVAESYEVQRLRRERAEAAARGLPVDVVRDGSKRDIRTFQGNVSRRNDAIEDAVNQYKAQDGSSLKVIRDTSGETELQRSRRLREEATEILSK